MSNMQMQRLSFLKMRTLQIKMTFDFSGKSLLYLALLVISFLYLAFFRGKVHYLKPLAGIKRSSTRILYIQADS